MYHLMRSLLADKIGRIEQHEDRVILTSGIGRLLSAMMACVWAWSTSVFHEIHEGVGEIIRDTLHDA